MILSVVHESINWLFTRHESAFVQSGSVCEKCVEENISVEKFWRNEGRGRPYNEMFHTLLLSAK
jgi:hypothetical protein